MWSDMDGKSGRDVSWFWILLFFEENLNMEGGGS